MFLKNYTSDVPVSESLARIEWVLIQCGVSGIAKEYSPSTPGKIVGVTFAIQLDANRLNIRLPVNEAACLDALWDNYQNSATNRRRLTKSKSDFQQQSERTAWRILKDWIEVQASMIQTKQARTLEVFLPYVWDGQESYYNKLVKSGGAKFALSAPSPN